MYCECREIFVVIGKTKTESIFFGKKRKTRIHYIMSYDFVFLNSISNYGIALAATEIK